MRAISITSLKGKKMAKTSNPVDHPEQWVTLADAAKRMGTGTHTVWNMARQGLIRKWLVGIRKSKYSLPDIEKLIARNNKKA